MKNKLLSILEILLGSVVLAAAVNALAAKVDLPLPVTLAAGVVAFTGLIAVGLLKRAPVAAVPSDTVVLRHLAPDEIRNSLTDQARVEVGACPPARPAGLGSLRHF